MSILILTKLTMNANYIIGIMRLIPTRLLSANLFMYERVTHSAYGSFFGAVSPHRPRRLPYAPLNSNPHPFHHHAQPRRTIERQDYEKR